MVDRRHAEEFLSKLPQDDPLRMLEEITFWLRALRDAYGVPPQRVFEVLDVFDVTARQPQRRLTAEYLALGTRYQKVQAQRTWNTSFQFWRELGATYQHLTDQYRKRVSGAETLRPILPIIVARGIRALKLELKWCLFRYGPVDNTLWKLAGGLYAYAEDSRFASNGVHVYPGAFKTSSPQREYLQVLMLGISAADSLVPEKLHLVERFIAHFAEFFAIERQPRKGCYYYVDTLLARPPARLVERLAPANGLRYFGPDRAAAMVDELIENIGTRGVVPPEINPGGVHDASAILEALDHLMRYWGSTPPLRSSQRHAAPMRVSVVHDFDSILNMISGDSAELDFDSNVETWSVENESEGGFGASITETVSDWLEVGSLLGIKLEDGATWGVGVVRRISRPNVGTIYVGIENLARAAVKVRLHLAGPAIEAAVSLQDAILLLSSSEGSAQTNELGLLTRAAKWTADQPLNMQAFGRSYALLPKKSMESGRDFERTVFRIIEPQRAAEAELP